MNSKYKFGGPPNKVWVEVNPSRGVITRKGWLHRRLQPTPTVVAHYQDWCKKKFAWGVTRYTSAGYRPVVKAAYGALTVVLYIGRHYPNRKEARRVGEGLAKVWTR